MLHDLARLYSGPRLIAACDARGIPVDPFERDHPLVLHAKVSAAIASERFGVRDPQVLSAISKHTTAAAAMSPLDCVVYLADSLEPQRSFPERAALWNLAMRDLTSAMRETLVASFGHLRVKGMPIAPQTRAAAVAFGAEVRTTEGVS